MFTCWLKTKMEQEERQELDQFEELIQGLIDKNYGCCNDFVSPSTILGLNENITFLNKVGNLKLSGIGNDAVVIKNTDIRGDKTRWIDRSSVNEHEVVYLKKLEKFIAHLNKTCFTSIKSMESHYSSYQTGAFYKRHLDQFKNEKGRQFSLILYLNEDWKTEDGGLLSLYPAASEQVNILPTGGRMVLFRSDEMEHEVLPSSTRERRSIAGWLKNN